MMGLVKMKLIFTATVLLYVPPVNSSYRTIMSRTCSRINSKAWIADGLELSLGHGRWPGIEQHRM